MFIQIQETPNPNSLKFIPGVRVTDTAAVHFTAASDLSYSPLAAILFSIDGILSVFIDEFFVTITKKEELNWDILRPFILAELQAFLSRGIPAIKAYKKEDNISYSETESEIVRQIKDILDNHIKPAVAQDGGDIVFHDFKDGIVYVRLHGACSGCPSSTITLKQGVERMLQHYVPEVLAVEHI